MRQKSAGQLLPVVLMVASLVLLMALQFLWLSKSFNDARHNVRRELAHLFDRTVRHIQDSLAMRFMDSAGIDGDSLVRRLLLPIDKAFKNTIDSIARCLGDSAYKMPILLSNANKSLHNRRHFHFWPRHVRFMLSASMPIDSSLILQRFKQEIAARDLKVSCVQVASFHFTEPPPTEEERRKAREQAPHILREKVFLFPGWGYQVQVEGFGWNAWLQIVPQLLFSLFLTSVTTAAFLFTYRGLQKQRRLSQIKDEFISNVTHELKTPVATVGVALEALSNFNVLKDSTMTAEYLEICKTELQRLSMMIEQIMQIAMLEEKGVHLQYTKVHAEELVRKVIASMRPQLEQSRAQVDFQAEGQNWNLYGDEVHLSNIVFNLLENALKYSPEPACIQVRLKETDKEIILSVKDEGIGIPSQYHKKIFDKFFRVPTGNIHNVKGYGLGLSYVAKIVKSHGGSITLQSTPGEGTTFFVHLPKPRVKVRQWQYEPFVF
ncbi:MAG: HAMP domain-containing sensor histidine kinase [Cytophagales bacterium]|nr:HAMP domain-containing histidine kinase [Bernardetiaceae bacterium]MDW8210401.1 HAMP domain-containing sensor histidine kinase [Cytophagales bacterium]